MMSPDRTRSSTSTATSVTRPAVCAASSACRTASTTPSQAWPAAAPSSEPATSVSSSGSGGSVASGDWPPQAAIVVASAAARSKRMCFMSAAATRAIGALADPHPLHHHSRRAESGEGGLEQVQADERGQQPPPWGDKLGQGHADEDHHAGEGHDRAIEGHGGFRCHCLSPWDCSGLSRSMPSRPRTYFSYTGSDVPWRIL